MRPSSLIFDSAKIFQLMNLEIYSDLQPVVNQVNGKYEARDPIMSKYLMKAKQLIVDLASFCIEQVSQGENANDDLL